MRSISHRRALGVLLLILLSVLAALLGACQTDGECKHQKTTDTLFEPDCSLQGYVLHECRDCGYSYKSDFMCL